MTSRRHPDRVSEEASAMSSAPQAPVTAVPAGTRARIAPTETGSPLPTHDGEPHTTGTAGRLNWLRAGVLGANDGIVSVAGIVVGVAGASAARAAVFTAGVAGLVAGAVSMALGEYVSVSSQRDSETAQMAQEKQELADSPEDELDELTALYAARGLSPATARQVAEELTERDALTAHLDAELGIDPDDLASPAEAAGASALSFTLGALLPLVAILLPPDAWRVPVCGAAVLVALAVTGTVSARLGGSSPARAVRRVVVGGALGLALTYGIGHLFGTAVG
jgi:VIT1/CCC1 family predicted Fe2+/Mn2+ transporter